MSKDKEGDDPYSKFLDDEKNKLDNTQVETSRMRKWKKFKTSAGQAQTMAYQGAIYGFLCGGTFGAVLGIVQAIQTRRLIAIPIAIVGSGTMFGFFFACGSIIRLDEQRCIEDEKYNEDLKYWKIKYGIKQQINLPITYE